MRHGFEHKQMDLDLAPPPQETGPDKEEERRIRRALNALIDRKVFTKEKVEALSYIAGLSTPQKAVFSWPGDAFKPKGMAIVEWDHEGHQATVALYEEKKEGGGAWQSN